MAAKPIQVKNQSTTKESSAADQKKSLVQPSNKNTNHVLPKTILAD